MEMYRGMVNSPVTQITADINSAQTTIPVSDASKLPSAPNLATLGVEENAETIKYEGKSGDNLTNVTRGFQGEAKAWSAGTEVARQFTEYDLGALQENVKDHVDADNPHGITPTKLGLGNVDDTSDADKPISTATQTALNGKVDKISGKGLSTNDYTTTEKDKLTGIEAGAQKNKVTSVAGKDGVVTLTKSDVGLGSVDNKSSATIRGEITSDNVTSALGYTPEDQLKKGQANGYASLDAGKKVPLAQLPEIQGMEMHGNEWHDEPYAKQADFASHLADFMPHGVDNAGFRNSIYRGKDLGTAVTAEQYNNIANGTFKDMYIGDYWTINGTKYLIAAFNYYYNTGDSALTQNHVTLVPDSIMYSHKMNSSNTTEGGYVGSLMYEEGLGQAKSTIKAAFPGRVMQHRSFLCNAVSDGEASAAAWLDSEVDLMGEVMVYGSVVNGHATHGLYNAGIDKSQLPLFALRPDLIGNRVTWWLRDVASASSFAFVGSSGLADRSGASGSRGVRPAFSIS